MKRLDLTGETFGKLTVLAPAAPINGRSAWLCRCECGREVTVSTDNLRRGLSTSCGNHRTSPRKGVPGNHEDLTGKTYGHLTALRYVCHDLWLWQCDCGRETTARVSDVKNGTTTSCGHVLSQASRKRVVEDNVLQNYSGTRLTTLKSIMAGKLRKNNSSGYCGIRQRGNRYQARITFQRRDINLGTFNTIEEAVAARREAEQRYFETAIEEAEL